MAPRTNADAVKALMLPGQDYDTDAAPSLTPFIETASALVDAVAACAVRKGLPLTAATLELIERWLSAHYYTRSDALYTSRTTEGASGSFVTPKDDPERYKVTALELDPSGCLAAILGRKRASVAWLGKRPSEQRTAQERW